MKLGLVSKKEIKGSLILERKMLGTHQVLKLTRERCIGCDICTVACPQEAVSLTSPVTEDGRLVKRRTADFDRQKCTFCGACVVLCPSSAIDIETNGKRNIGVVESKVFPTLLREIEVDVDKCEIECNYVCQDSCPTEACPTRIISRGNNGSLSVDERFCIYCNACQAACPEKIISVTRTGILHTDISSGAWITALEKLTSRVQMVKELSARASEKTREAGRSLGRF